MNIQTIKTDADYKAALDSVESLMNAKAGTSEGRRLDALVELVEAFERIRFPIESDASSNRTRS